MITISPTNPTSTDIITLTVTDFRGYVGSATLTNESPVFTAKVTEVGFPGEPYTFNFQIGPLSEGQYTMFHNYYTYRNLAIPVTSEHITVNVSQAANPPATAVPSISLIGLTMLTTLLLASGKYYFNKK